MVVKVTSGIIAFCVLNGIIGEVNNYFLILISNYSACGELEAKPIAIRQ